MNKSFSLIYGTNIVSHHQLPVASNLVKLLGLERFKMAVFEDVYDERRKMGWNEGKEFPWVIGPPHGLAETKALMNKCIEADVMVVGACPQNIIEARVASGKLTFIAGERILKKPFYRLRTLNPRYLIGMNKYCKMANRPNVHALAVGHYAADDLHKIGAFSDRIWKWGYFVDVSEKLSVNPPIRPLKILWCGRMLRWKRVDILLKAVALLKDSGCIDSCIIVGDGPERTNLLDLARKLNLTENIVQFKPSVSFSDVRRLMRDSDVYALTSNRHEGWGAVAGEAMSEGCVLVANEQAGSARDLIIDGKTGLLFKDGDSKHLASCIKLLGDNYNNRMQIRYNASKMMQSIWSPSVAAERLVKLIDGLLINRPPDFNEGPCLHVKK